MITIKEPIHLNSLSRVCKTNDAFADRIMANYELFPLHFTPEQLLFLLKGQNEEGVNTTEITQLVNNENINNNITLNVNILNKFTNRAMAVVDSHYTYQDLVYVSSFLAKSGIKNVKQFLTDMTEYVSETKQVIKENKLFEENSELVKKFSEDVYLYNQNKNYTDKEETNAGDIMVSFASALLKKLNVAENTEYISQSAKAVSVNSDCTRVVQNLSCIKMNEYAGYMEQKLYDYGSSTYEYLHVNPYELSFLNNTDSSTVMENIIASVLLNLTDDLFVLNSKSNVESSSFSVDSFNNFTEQISDSVMRFIAYHSAPVYKNSVYLSKHKRVQHLKKLKAVEQFVYEMKNEMLQMTQELYNMVESQSDTHIENDRSERIDLINRVYEDYISQQLIEKVGDLKENVTAEASQFINNQNTENLNENISIGEAVETLELTNVKNISGIDNNIQNINSDESVKMLELTDEDSTDVQISEISESVTAEISELINNRHTEIINNDNNISGSEAVEALELTNVKNISGTDENIQNINESAEILKPANVSHTDISIQNVNSGESAELLGHTSVGNVSYTDNNIQNINSDESVEILEITDEDSTDVQISEISERVTAEISELINNQHTEIINNNNNNISSNEAVEALELTNVKNISGTEENIQNIDEYKSVETFNSASMSNTDNDIQNINGGESFETSEHTSVGNVSHADRNIYNINADESVEILELTDVDNTDVQISEISESVTAEISELINNQHTEIINNNNNISSNEAVEALELTNVKNISDTDENVQNINSSESFETSEFNDISSVSHSDNNLQDISESVTAEISELINNQHTEIINNNNISSNEAVEALELTNVRNVADNDVQNVSSISHADNNIQNISSTDNSSEEYSAEENIKNIYEALGAVNMKVDIQRARKESLLALENQELILKQVNDTHTDVSQYREELKNSLYAQVSEETKEILEKAELYMKDPEKAQELGVTEVHNINEINSILNEYYNDNHIQQAVSSSRLTDVEFVDIDNTKNSQTINSENTDVSKVVSEQNTSESNLNIQTEEFNTRYIKKMYEILNNLIKNNTFNGKNLYDSGGEIVNIIQHIVNEQKNVSVEDVIETAVYNYSQQHMEDKFTHIAENISDSSFTYAESAVFSQEELSAVMNFAEDHSLYSNDEVSYKTMSALIRQAENTSFKTLQFVYDRDEKEDSDIQKSGGAYVNAVKTTESTASVNNSISYEFNTENVSEHTDSVNISEYPSSVTKHDEKTYYDNLQKNIENVIDRQISNISERVYSRLEKKMSNERKRRGY